MSPETLVRAPRLAGSPGADGFVEETVRYRARPRPKSKFHTVLDAHIVFGRAQGETLVRTRVAPAATDGQPMLDVEVGVDLGGVHLKDRLVCLARGDGLVAGTLRHTVGDARQNVVDFTKTPWPLPPTTYPEVLLPFLLRGQPRDGVRRALYAWTSDRFVARVYYESRGTRTLDLPAGRVEATEVWMYPDLNDWVKLGNVITRMIKPFLPRYEMWFETLAPHRLVRFEGSFGPPGAPEIILELC